ncbi:MAG: G5 domain-containing protein [Eubacterium sp.]|nr:G5 domain-containing protein [Eubacterium sp.]
MKKLIATLLAVVIATAVFTSTAYAEADGKYGVKIIDSGVETAITTTATEPVEIIKTAGITLNSDDKMDITGYREGEGGTIVINRLKSINVKFGDIVNTYDVYASTVGEALKEAGLTVADKAKTNYSANDSVKDGMVIDIKSAPHVTVKADGKKIKVAKTTGTVKEALELAGVELGDDDYTKPALDKEIKSGLKIKVYRVEYKEVTKTKTVKYKTIEKKSKKMEYGKTKVVIEGKNGKKKLTYKVKLVNGKETDREVIDEEVLEEATDKVVKVGTKRLDPDVKPNGVKSANGISLGQTISGRYTHYCACATCNGSGSGVTSSGKRIYNGMANPYYIACNWLPLGSVIKVDGQNYTVVDRGGSGLSSVGRIDIFTPEGHAACYRLGTGSCTIKVIRLGW